jgi:L-cystine uptake protein TcyP (sodium:dicarboxylate symporter family)
MSLVKAFTAKPVVSMRIKAILLLMFSGSIAANCVVAIAGTYNNNSEVKQTNSKRIEVYSLSQNYWDTHYGDTLSEITLHLLPNNPARHEALKREIVHLNPHAFINGNPEKLLANKRLWLPGYMKQADSKVNPSTTTVETYSWGNIKRPR